MNANNTNFDSFIKEAINYSLKNKPENISLDDEFYHIENKLVKSKSRDQIVNKRLLNASFATIALILLLNVSFVFFTRNNTQKAASLTTTNNMTQSDDLEIASLFYIDDYFEYLIDNNLN